MYNTSFTVDVSNSKEKGNYVFLYLWRKLRTPMASIFLKTSEYQTSKKKVSFLIEGTNVRSSTFNSLTGII